MPETTSWPLAGIHDAERIEHRLDAAHQLDRDLVLDVGQFVALEHADAVLGGDRSAHPQHDLEHHGVDLVPARQEIGGVAADRLADIVVDVAVAEMAERHRPRARNQLDHGGIGFRDEIGHGGDRHRDVVLDRAAFRLLRRRHFVAQLPERLALAQIRRDHGVVDDAVFHALARIDSSASRASSREDDSSISTYQGCLLPGIADVDAVAHAEIDRDVGQQFETGEAAGGLRSARSTAASAPAPAIAGRQRRSRSRAASETVSASPR
jgi:hypothetical protein